MKWDQLKVNICKLSFYEYIEPQPLAATNIKEMCVCSDEGALIHTLN